jgi:hypothetical protein
MTLWYREDCGRKLLQRAAWCQKPDHHNLFLQHSRCGGYWDMEWGQKRNDPNGRVIIGVRSISR